MTEQLANSGHTTIAEDLDDTETTVTVTSGAVFPSSGNFRVKVDDELMLVTARSTNDLTVTRGIESTTAAAHTNGAAIDAVLTAGGLTTAIGENSGTAVQLSYQQFTSVVNPTATTDATANTVVTADAIVFDGATRVCIEFFSPFVRPAASAAAQLVLVLYDGSSNIDRIAVEQTPAATNNANRSVMARRYLTPSAGSHTYSIRAYVSTGTGTVGGGPGGTAADYAPGYIRITMVEPTVNVASGGYPEGTSFPGSPTTGQVYRRTDIRGGMLFRYDGTRWLSEQILTTGTVSFSNITADTGHIYPQLPADYPVYITQVHFLMYVTGSVTWVVTVYANDYDNGLTSLVSKSTAGLAASKMHHYTENVNTVVDTDNGNATAEKVSLAILFDEQTGSSAFYGGVTIDYRLIAT